jgi:hypothetical protein
VTVAAVEEGRTAAEATASQAALEPLTGVGSGSANVVMVPSDEDSALPPPAGDRDVVMSMVPEPSPVAAAASVEDVMDLAACWFVDFPGIWTVDLDAPDLLSNDLEMLEVATEQMFAEPSILETIVSVASALRQCEGAAGSALPAAPEAAKGVLEESTTGAESAVVVPAPSPTRKGQDASLPQSAEAVTSAAANVVADVAEGVVGEVGPSSPRPVAAAVEEALVLGEPAAAPQECVSPEGTTRVASPEIQEAVEDSGAALSQGAASGGAQALELACTPWAAAFEAGDDTDDDEEVAARNTLERRLE